MSLKGRGGFLIAIAVTVSRGAIQNSKYIPLVMLVVVVLDVDAAACSYIYHMK